MVKKGVFEPDALIGVVILIVICIAGIFFLNTYVSGVAMQGLLSILDQESDQSCFLLLVQLSGDSYIRTGEKVGGTDFSDITDRYKKIEPASQLFEERIAYLNSELEEKDYPMDITEIFGFMANERESRRIRQEFLMEIPEDPDKEIVSVCMVPVYGPVEGGFAQLYMIEED